MNTGQRASVGAGHERSDRDFTGQRLDSEAALLDFVARRYNSYLGRFIQPDSLIPDPGNPQDLNRYAYARNNTLRYTDPSGHCPLCIGVGVLIAVGYELLARPDTAHAPSLDVNVAELPPSEIPIQSRVESLAVNSVLGYMGASEAKASWDLYRWQQAAVREAQAQKGAAERATTTVTNGAARPSPNAVTGQGYGVTLLLFGWEKEPGAMQTYSTGSAVDRQVV